MVLRENSNVTLEPKIAANYGDLSWRDEQCVIDLLQNHLDANLVRSTQSGEPFELPRITLRVSNGTHSKSVSLSEVAHLDESWEISGLRISDHGRGFSHELLGLMGTTTKREHENLRGGLGEGLKMSVNHCVRAGVGVTLKSMNSDGAWIVSPAHLDDTLVFTGQLVEFDRASLPTGTFTELDFTSCENREFKAKLIDCIDPRKGEGLGRYSLEFRDKNLQSIVDKNVELTEFGVPPGRVYVLGLLVEDQRSDMLFSYNLGDKFAIGGRDRKHVDVVKLQLAINKYLETLEARDKIELIFEALRERKATVETKWINGPLGTSLKFGSASSLALWKECFEKTFEFKVGESLLATADLDENRKRALKEQGYKLIEVSPEHNEFIRFIEKIYPDQALTTGALELRLAAAAQSQNADQSPSGKLSPVVWGKLAQIQFDSDWLRVPQTQQRVLRMSASSDVARQGVIYHQASNQLLVHPAAVVDAPFRYRFLGELLLADARAMSHSPNTQEVIDQHFRKIGGPESATLQQVIENHPVLPANLQFSTEQPAAIATLQTDIEISIDQLKASLGDSRLTKAEVEERLEKCSALVAALGAKLAAPRIIYRFDDQYFSIAERGGKYALQPIAQEDFSAPPTTDERYQEFAKSSLNTKLVSTQNIEPQLFEKLSKGATSKWLNTASHILERHGFFGSFLKSEKNLIRYTTIRNNTPIVTNFVPTVIEPKANWQTIDLGATLVPIDIPEGECRILEIRTGERSESVPLYKFEGRIYADLDRKEWRSVSDVVGASLNFSQCDVEFGVSTLILRSNAACEFRLIQPTQQKETLLETNRGRNTIETAIDIDYGKGVWDEPRRILFDALQNHVDASRIAPTLKFYVLHRWMNDQVLAEVSAQEFSKLPAETTLLVGFSAEDQGVGYPTPYLQRLGSSTKGTTELGKFGEGLKMIAAASKRMGLHMQLESRDWSATPTVIEKPFKDFERDENKLAALIGYNVAWRNTPRIGSRTTLSLIPIENLDRPISAHDIRTVLIANFADGQQAQSWHAWSQALRDLAAGGEDLVLPEGEKLRLNATTSLLKTRAGLYEGGMLVETKPTENLLGGYDFKLSLTSTRERSRVNTEGLKAAIDKAWVRPSLEMAKEALRRSRLLGFDTIETISIANNNQSSCPAIWRKAFSEEFGENAILSLQSLTDVPYLNQRTIQFAAANERHLPAENLIHLPKRISMMLKSGVRNSLHFYDQMTKHPLAIDDQLRAAIYSHLKRFNDLFLEALQKVLSNPEKLEVLSGIVNIERINELRVKLRSFSPDSFQIVENEAYLGQFHRDSETFSYSPSLLNDLNELKRVHIHELCHMFSGADDYTSEFITFMLLIAETTREPAVRAEKLKAIIRELSVKVHEGEAEKLGLHSFEELSLIVQKPLKNFRSSFPDE